MWLTNALSDKYLLNTYKGPGDTVGNKAETLALDLTLKNETFCVSTFSKWLKLIFLNIKFFILTTEIKYHKLVVWKKPWI